VVGAAVTSSDFLVVPEVWCFTFETTTTVLFEL
jgi:hypothetical protein